MSAPLVTIFVRHSADCKYKEDETWKRCTCRKHFRWTLNGKQYRQKAGTRSWEEAERNKRILEDKLAGRAQHELEKPTGAVLLADAIKTFLADKKTQGVVEKTLEHYIRALTRLRAYADAKGALFVSGLTLEFLIAYRATWAELYPSSTTQHLQQQLLKGFLRFCYDMKYLDRMPRLSPIKKTAPPTLPLTAEEYAHLLAVLPSVFPDKTLFAKVRAVIQLMRWTGLAIRDAVCLRRDSILYDKSKGFHRIVTARQKTGVAVSVPVPPDVAKEVLKVLNGNPTYVFWRGEKLDTDLRDWHTWMRDAFTSAGLVDGFMVSHRLRDTFAVDLLEKGAPMEEVSKMLGHTSIRTTEEYYAKWVKSRQDRLDSLVTAAWAK